MKEFHLLGENYEEIFPKIITEIDTKNAETYIFHYKSDFANSKIIRDFVGTIFDSFEVPMPWRGRFILITDELINNSIEHGSLADDINECIITTHLENNEFFRISLEVHDTGKGEKKSASEELNQKKSENTNIQEGQKITENSEKIYMGKRGRGLFHITEKIVDKLTFGQSQKGGLMVKIEKCINKGNENCHKGEKKDGEKTEENQENSEKTK